MSIKLDLKSFKHVKSDKDTTTLQHKQGGHMLTINHNALSPENKAQLNALSKVSSEAATPLQADASMHQQKMADGGEVDEYGYPKNTSGDKPLYDTSGYTKKAEGGEVEAEQPLSKEQHLNEMHKSVKSMAELKAKHGEAALKLREYFAHSMKAEKHARMAEEPEHLAQGGKVADAHSMGDKAKHQDQKAPKESAQAPHEANRQSERVLEAPVQMDEASEQSPIDSDHQHEGKAYCMHCGGKMMAEGGLPDPSAAHAEPVRDEDPEIIERQQAVEQDRQDEANAKSVEEDKKKNLQNKYNTAVVENAQRMNGGSLGGPLAGLSSLSRIIGPDGAAPKRLDPDAAVLAKERFDQEEEDAKKQKEQAEQSDAINAQKAAEAAQMLGVSAPAIPGVPAANQAQGAQTPTLPPPVNPAKNPPASSPDDQGGRGDNTDLGGLYDQMRARANAGIEGQQQTAESQGRAESQAIDEHRQATHQAMTHFDNTIQDLENERLALVKDVQDGHIDSDKYWQGSKDPATGQMTGGHSKVASAIGMILAGFNPTSNPNAAIGMLKFQMEQNLQAQAQNLNSKNNLLRANLDQFHNVRNAMDMTRLMLSDDLQARLGKAAAQAKTQGAAAAANLAKAQLAKESFPMASQLYLRHALSTLGQSGANPKAQELALQHLAATPGGQEVYKEFAPRFIPGVGFATNSVSPEVRQQLLSHQKFDASVKDLMDFVSQNGGTMQAMNPATRDVAAQKAMILQSLFREGTLGTVYKSGEQPLLDKAVKSQPLNFLDYVTGSGQAKLNEMRRANDRAYNTTLGTLGGDAARVAQQRIAAANQPPVREGTIIVNKRTGERQQWSRNGWRPIK